jgi:hypothetical protein
LRIKKGQWTKNILSFIPAALITATILFFSSQPATSQAVRSFPLPPKLGHFTGYFMLAATTYWGLQGKKVLGAPWGRAALGSFLWALLVAFLDEFNQGMLPSRIGSIYDVFIDAAGAGTALMLLLGISRITEKNSSGLRGKGKD